MRRIRYNDIASFVAPEKAKPVVKTRWRDSQNVQVAFTLFAILAIGLAMLIGGAKLIEHEAQETRARSL
jgi:hypothetical protein